MMQIYFLGPSPEFPLTTEFYDILRWQEIK